MQDIYSSASRVVVWLGPADGKTPSRFERIRKFAGSPEAHWIMEGEDAEREDIDRFRRNDPDSTTLFLHRLRSLLREAWFTRVWTVQEYAVAKNVVFVQGHSCLDGTDLEGMLSSFTQHYTINHCCDLGSLMSKTHFGYLWDLLRRVESYRTLVELRDKAPQHPFLQVVPLFQDRKATDARDRAYAFIGISQGINPQIIDYTLSTPEAYERITREIIEHTGNLGVLSYMLPPHSYELADDTPPYSLPSLGLRLFLEVAEFSFYSQIPSFIPHSVQRLR